MAEERGPSYWDCAEYMQHIGAKYDASIRVLVYPPHKAGHSARWTSWSVCCEVWKGAARYQGVCDRVEYFGSGGAWKTLPSALHAALRTLEERLELRAEEAAANAAF